MNDPFDKAAADPQASLISNAWEPTTVNSPFDKPRAIFASVVAAVIGWAVFMGMPILVGALADTRGFTESQAGYIASADLGGMLFSSVLVSIFVKKLDRRRWILIGALIAISANFICVQVDSFWDTLGLRIIAGFGSGFCYAIALANLSASSNTARNFSYLIFTLVSINAIELYTLPHVVTSYGVEGIFYAFIVINIICLSVYPLLPRGHVKGEHVPSKAEVEALATGEFNDHHDEPQPATYNLALLGWLCLSAVGMFYVMIGAFWAYIERLGVNVGFSDEFIATALAATTALSLTGAYIAYKISQNQGQSKPLLGALLIIAGVLVWLGASPVAFAYAVVLGVYQLMWNGVDIYQLGTLANIDHSGKYAALVPAAQGLGQTIGPSAAAVLIGQGMGYSSVMYLCAAMAIGTAIIYAFVYAILKRSAPEIADA